MMSLLKHANRAYSFSRQTPTLCAESVSSSPTTRQLCSHMETRGFFILLNPQQVTLRCWKNGAWTTRTASLIGNGMVMNATGCSMSTGAFHTLPELQGSSQPGLDAPRFHLPDKLSVDANAQSSVAPESMPAELTQLDDVLTQLQAQRQTLDVDSLLHVHQTSLQHAQQ
jgi:hypothetical protein